MTACVCAALLPVVLEYPCGVTCYDGGGYLQMHLNGESDCVQFHFQVSHFELTFFNSLSVK